MARGRAAPVLLSRPVRDHPDRDPSPRGQHADLGAGRRDIPSRGPGLARGRGPDRGELPLGNLRPPRLYGRRMGIFVRLFVAVAVLGACGAPQVTSASTATGAPPPANEQIYVATDRGTSVIGQSGATLRELPRGVPAPD